MVAARKLHGLAALVKMFFRGVPVSGRTLFGFAGSGLLLSGDASVVGQTFMNFLRRKIDHVL